MSEPEPSPAESPAPPSAEPAPAPADPQPAPPPSEPAQPYQSASRSSPLGYVFFGGLFALLTGIAWIWVEPETGVFSKVWIFAALLAMLVPLAWHGVDFAKAVASRRGAAFGFVVITLSLGLAITGFVGWAEVKFKASMPQFDLTKASRYSLSEESEKLLAKVDGTIYATYLIHGRTDEGLRADAIEQLHVYESATSHVKVAEVDELRNPDVAARTLREQGVGTTSSGEDTDVIVLTYAEAGKTVAPGKQKEIKVEPWSFRKTSSTGEDKWLGEAVISSGIFELVFQKYKAYATGGHGERAMGEEFHELKGVLTTQNIDVEAQALNLSSNPKIPDDCALLLVLGPTAPFSPEEAEAVTKWVEKGKALLLTVDVASERFSTGLDALLEKFGVATRTNYEVVAPKIGRLKINDREVDMVQGMESQFPVYGDAYSDHPAAAGLRARSGLATYFFRTSYIEVDEKPPAGADPQVVCSAPDRKEQGVSPVALNHYKGRTSFDTFQEGKDQKGIKLPLIVTSVRTIAPAAGGATAGADAKGTDARLVLSADTDVFTDRVIGSYPANLDLARGLVQWALRREALVAVSARTLEDPYVAPTEYQRRFALVWPLFACFLPLLMGGLVWWTRRR